MIAITADLHLAITPKQTIIQLAKDIALHSPKFVILGGDIAECRISTDLFKECISIIQDITKSTVGIVIGNHDLWTSSKKVSSLQLWEQVLPKITQELGAIWLEGENIYTNGIAIVGSYLHYDYSAKENTGPTAGLSDDYFKTNKKRCINDARFFTELPEDIEFADSIGTKFIQRLHEAENKSDVSEIVIVTHVPCVDALVTRMPQNFDWAIMTPYFGNITYEKDILSLSKLTHIYCGHTHVYENVDITQGNRKIKAINIGSDYGNPRFEIKPN